jgi:hypothetical protein
MNQKDHSQFAKLMIALNEVFGRGEMSELKMEIYFKALQDFSIEQVSRGISTILANRTLDNFPKPGEIKEAIEGTPDDQALEAWTRLFWAIKNDGGYTAIIVDEPTAIAVEQMGGWQELCMMLTKERGFKRAEFLKLYQLALKQGIKDGRKKLMGLHDADNIKKGFSDHISKPIDLNGQTVPQLTGGDKW